MGGGQQAEVAQKHGGQDLTGYAQDKVVPGADLGDHERGSQDHECRGKTRQEEKGRQVFDLEKGAVVTENKQDDDGRYQGDKKERDQGRNGRPQVPGHHTVGGQVHGQHDAHKKRKGYVKYLHNMILRLDRFYNVADRLFADCPS